MEPNEAISEFPIMMDDFGNVPIEDLETALEMHSPEINPFVPTVNPSKDSLLRGNQAAGGKDVSEKEEEKVKSDTINPSQRKNKSLTNDYDDNIEFVDIQLNDGVVCEFEERYDNQQRTQSSNKARISKWIECIDKEDLDNIIQTDLDDNSPHCEQPKEWPLLNSRSINRNHLDFDLSGGKEKHKYASDENQIAKEASTSKKLRPLSDTINPFQPNIALTKQRPTTKNLKELDNADILCDIEDDFHCSQMSASRFKEWIDFIDIEHISNSPVDRNPAKGSNESHLLHSNNNIQRSQNKPQNSYQSYNQNHLDFDLGGDGGDITKNKDNRTNHNKYDSEIQTANEVVFPSIQTKKVATHNNNPSQAKIALQKQNQKHNSKESDFDYADYVIEDLPCSQLSQNSNNHRFKEWIDFGDIEDISNSIQIDIREKSPTNKPQEIVLSPISIFDKSIAFSPPIKKGLDKSLKERKLLTTEDMQNNSQLEFMQQPSSSSSSSSSSLFIDDAKRNDFNKRKLSSNSLLNRINSSSKKLEINHKEERDKENSLQSKFMLNEQNQNHLPSISPESISNLNQIKLLSGQDSCQNDIQSIGNQFSLSEDNFNEQKNKSHNSHANEMINTSMIFRRGSQRKTSPDISLVPPSIKKLYDLILDKHSEYAFVYAISAQLCQERVPMESYVYFKMSLLLSLASFEPNSNRPPVSLLIVCYDTYMANYLVSTVGKLAKRFIGPYDKIRNPLQKCANFKVNWNEANPLMLSQGGVYYAGDWKRFKNSETETLLKYVENSTVTSDRSKDEIPLDTAIWSLWHPGDDFKRETLHKFFLVFGLPIIMEDDDNDEVILDYVLNRYRVGVYEASTDFLSIPFEEMREFLNQITKLKVTMTSAAIKLLQQYFVVTRYVRPNVLSKQSFVVLKLFAESFAKLSLRTEVIEMDAVASIFLCENFIHNLYGRSKNSPPKFMTFTHIAKVDSFMTEFYNWLQNYLHENYDECNAADFTKFSEYKD